MSPRAAAVAVAIAGLLAACRVGPDYAPPELPAPDAWHQQLADGTFQDGHELARWWMVLGDPLLDDLVARAASGNLDVRTALARVEEARARYRIVAGRRWPDVDGGGSGARVRSSENTPFAMPGSGSDDASSWSLGLDAFWEVDLWGRVARSVEAAEADVQTARELERDVRVTLFSEVAATYVALRTAQERLRIARENVARQEESLQLAEVRFDTGLSPRLDVAQAQRILASTEAEIPAFEQDMRLLENRLAVLVGAAPGALAEELAAVRPIPAPPASIVAGVPADLLRQRPDLRAAERALAAATARVGVSEADLYPQLGLRGTWGAAAEDLDDLTRGSSRTFDVGGVLAWNLFDGGRVRGAVDVSEARVAQALTFYEQALLLALEETEAALTSFVLEQRRVAALDRAVTAAAEALELSRTLYREGLSDFQNVIDAQQALLREEDRRAVSRGRVAGNLIAAYRALGGGWASGDGLD